ncbi:hypothetical protein DL1_08460 [Thioclava dalianensis]|uniref:Uncharacterized protein n=1 Tax=Thioclava dalianensis TaxID=1185766 RepID=A0A074TAV1_9RHOB|nr:hypothetical protein [Thioclava dalianensis]KEP68809.1 hypothetical protein DL1_08460 [Thioclava dalianensis]SFN50338.1 hypothetical protein SAMN05216224_10696 [Thioclava dalianensis]
MKQLFCAIIVIFLAAPSTASEYKKNFWGNWEYTGEVNSRAVDAYTNDARVAVASAAWCRSDFVGEIAYHPESGKVIVVKKSYTPSARYDMLDVVRYFLERHLKVTTMIYFDKAQGDVVISERVFGDLGGKSRYFLLHNIDGSTANVSGPIGDVSSLCHRG